MKILYLLFMFASAIAIKKNYEGYNLYKVKPNNKNQVAVLNDVQKSGIGEVWEEYVVLNKEVRVMVSKEKQEQFIALMDDAKIETVLVLTDLQKYIDDQLKPAESISRNTENFHSMTWDRYYSYTEIYDWLDELESNYPSIIDTVTWGRSNEDREIKGIIIDHHPERKKPIGVLEGTLHAREWISPATITWIIKEFLTSGDPEVKALAENFQWHIVPITNPDGYAYSFTDNRMWRKNRNTLYNTTCAEGVDDDMSNGVDLNRNFDFHWMEAGASNNPCSNTFAGSTANSEPETRAVVNYLNNLKDDGEIIYYLSFHSYTQLVVIPYSHVSTTFQMLEMGGTNYADMFEIGSRAAEALEKRFGTNYRVGISAEVLYPMSGGSFDWVKQDIGVPVCYLIELRDLGEFGFLLPPEQIIPNNLEIMEFMKEMDRATRALGYYSISSGVTSIFSSMVLTMCGVIISLYMK